jgi:hypothetical protein
MKEIILPQGNIPIINGPTKFDLSYALFGGKIVKIKVQTSKLIKQTEDLDIFVLSIKANDNTREKWSGEISFATPPFEGKMAKIFYDTENKTGYINLF